MTGWMGLGNEKLGDLFADEGSMRGGLVPIWREMERV